MTALSHGCMYQFRFSPGHALRVSRMMVVRHNFTRQLQDIHLFVLLPCFFVFGIMNSAPSICRILSSFILTRCSTSADTKAASQHDAALLQVHCCLKCGQCQICSTYIFKMWIKSYILGSSQQYFTRSLLLLFFGFRCALAWVLMGLFCAIILQNRLLAG